MRQKTSDQTEEESGWYSFWSIQNSNKKAKMRSGDKP
jgi:hypothetical protein